MIILKEITKQEDWMIHGIAHSVPVMQTFVYGEIQKKTGRNIKRFQILDDNQIVGYVQFIVYPLFGDKVYWYSPYGPVLKKVTPDILKSLKIELNKLSKNSNIVFIRLDFTPVINSESLDQTRGIFVAALKSSYIGAYFQPRHEWYTDISKTPDEILSKMHQKTRYSVRLAEKKGVVTKIITSNLLEKFDDFMSLMKGTAHRNKFALHNDEYYRAYFEEVEKNGNAFIIEAWSDNSLLASHFVVVEGKTAHYLFGASSDEKRELCAPYLAHFNAMKECRVMGCDYYNFGAVSIEGENDHWASLTIFKQKFGGHVVTHGQFFDLVSKPFWYYIYIARKFIKSFI
jgi:peptidoglycan pentaglycine glycine transferase (the first glycine)